MKSIILIVLFVLFGSNTVQAQELMFSTLVDLNSDNITETVKVEETNNPLEFRLSIGNKTIIGKLHDGELEGFKVIDINTHDPYKEIAVYTSGSSDDYEHHIYWYNGKNIVFMGYLWGLATFKGNGIIYSDGWMGFWYNREKYILDETNRTLKLVEQFAYYVGITLKVKNGFKIYKEKALRNKVALLSNDSEIVLILCDKDNSVYPNHKYLIKSQSGLLGWANLKIIEANTEGIQTAD